MTNIIIAGIGQTAAGEHWELSLRELAYKAMHAAILESGSLKPQALFVGNMLSLNLSNQAHLGALLADYAGLDGIENKIDPGQPLDKDIYGLSPEELKDIPSAPGTLEEALKCLKDDHEFLLKGDVFTPDVIEKWIEYKTEAEVNPVRMRPVPLEFELYYDI